MNHLLHPVLFPWVLQTTWQAAVLAGLILAAQWLLRKRLSPAWRYGLWLLLVVRLLMPVSPHSAFSIFNLARTAPKPPVTAASTPGLDKAVVRQPVGIIPRDVPLLAEPQRAALVVPAPPAAKASAKVDWYAVAFCGWLAGVCFFGARLVWTNARFRARIARYQPVADEKVTRLFHDCRAAFQITQPMRLIESEEVESPAVYGLGRKWLLLPDGVFERFSTGELRHIFLHELAHVKRRDIEVNWLAALLQILHWFNPVLWLAFARMRADRELATDALALAHVGRTENVRYGETILKVVENLARGAVQPGLVGIAEGKAGLKERLCAIARSGAARPWRWAAIGTAALVAAVGLTTARQTHQPEAAGKPQATAISSNLSAGAAPAPQVVHVPMRLFVFRVSDYESGTPLAGATVAVTSELFDGMSIQQEARTGADGRAYVPITSSLSELKRLAYVAQKTNYLTLQGEWFDQELSLLGDEYAVKLSQGTEIGGSVVDENGKPVANAEVSFDQGMRLLLSAGHYRTDHAELWVVPPGQHVAVTGPDGAWKAKCIWPDFQWASLRIHHPDFADIAFSTDLTSAMQAEGKGVKVSFADLTNRAVRLTLSKGVAVKGRVINEAGAPFPGIKVSYAELLTSEHARDQLLGQRAITTDAAGKFQLDHAPLKHLFFMVQTPGYGPAVAELDPAAPGSDVELRLAKGIKLSGAVKDDSDNPLANARVAFADYSIWRGIQWETVTDGNGRFQWNDAPAEVFQLQIQ
ncbi:MAG: M56 family metallopeptidase, partial [Verrucomicrobiota bacterium]